MYPSLAAQVPPRPEPAARFSLDACSFPYGGRAIGILHTITSKHTFHSLNSGNCWTNTFDNVQAKLTITTLAYTATVLSMGRREWLANCENTVIVISNDFFGDILDTTRNLKMIASKMYASET